MENVKNAIKAKNLESFNRHLADLEKFCDETVFCRLLFYAAKAGSIPMMNILIEKGAGKAPGKLKSGIFCSCTHSQIQPAPEKKDLVFTVCSCGQFWRNLYL